MLAQVLSDGFARMLTWAHELAEDFRLPARWSSFNKLPSLPYRKIASCG